LNHTRPEARALCTRSARLGALGDPQVVMEKPKVAMVLALLVW
jgi:hypothetical protein